MTDVFNLSNSAADQFRDAIAERGLVPPETIIPDGRIHRFSSSGSADGNAGWYMFYDDGVATGSFGDFRTGIVVKSWTAPNASEPTTLQKKAFDEKQSALRAQREADLKRRRLDAQIKASTIVRISSPASDTHPYLVRKQIQSFGVRQWNNLLVIPMIDETGNLQSLQLIDADGGKKFLSGGKVQGCYFAIGDIEQATTILIAEGYATAATLHEAVGLPVIVAFNAGNLLSVSKTIRAHNPKSTIILCADDDYKTVGNPGLTKAHEAAEIIDGRVIAPFFGSDRPDRATDFNDMACHLGLDAVNARFISRSLDLSYRAPLMAAMRRIAGHAFSPTP